MGLIILSVKNVDIYRNKIHSLDINISKLNVEEKKYKILIKNHTGCCVIFTALIIKFK